MDLALWCDKCADGLDWMGEMDLQAGAKEELSAFSVGHPFCANQTECLDPRRGT